MNNYNSICLGILFIILNQISWAQSNSSTQKTKEIHFYGSFINTSLHYGPTDVSVNYRPPGGTSISDVLPLDENKIAKGIELNFSSLRNNLFGFRGGIAFSVGKDAVNLLELSVGPHFRILGKKKFKVFISAIGVVGSGGLHLGSSENVWGEIVIVDTPFISDDVDMSFRNGFWGVKPGLSIVQKFGKKNKFGLEFYGGFRYSRNTTEWVAFSGYTYDGDDDDDDPDFAMERLPVDNKSLIVKTSSNKSEIIEFIGPELKVSLVVKMR